VPKKENEMETLYLDGLEYPERQLSCMACFIGAARYLGCDEPEAWLYGTSGMAFFSHMNKGGVCPSYPSDWNWHACIQPMRNAGVSLETVHAPHGDLPKVVKTLLSEGVPVCGFSTIPWENVLVRGFTDTPKGESIRYLYLTPDEGQFNPWEKFESTPTKISLVPPSDTSTAIKMGLQCAVEMNMDTKQFLNGQADNVMGYEAFYCAATWLEKEQDLDHAFTYNVAVWEECRRNAVDFVGQANARLDDDALTKLFEELERLCKEIHGDLKTIVDTFGDTMPAGKHEEYAKHLRHAGDTEKAAVALMEEIISHME
jgi:hypothetical protein